MFCIAQNPNERVNFSVLQLALYCWQDVCSEAPCGRALPRLVLLSPRPTCETSLCAGQSVTLCAKCVAHSADAFLAARGDDGTSTHAELVQLDDPPCSANSLTSSDTTLLSISNVSLHEHLVCDAAIYIDFS